MFFHSYLVCGQISGCTPSVCTVRCALWHGATGTVQYRYDSSCHELLLGSVPFAVGSFEFQCRMFCGFGAVEPSPNCSWRRAFSGNCSDPPICKSRVFSRSEIFSMWHRNRLIDAVVTRHLEGGGDFLLAVLRTGLTRAPLLLLLGFVFISREGRHKEKLP